jgi:U3 small nucleolar ribonucleoprotein protein LCP5
MAVDNSLESLLATLTTSIQSATEALPKDEILPPKDGISLLDVKNELLLSYLQNLVFLILLKLRARSEKNNSEDETLSPQDDVVKKLVELRVYLEKGVRPLENRLKYQIDKIVRSADDAARKSTQAAKQVQARKSKAQEDSESDASEAESDVGDEERNGMSYGPRAAAISRPRQDAREKASSASKDGIYRPPRITPVSMPTTESREPRQSRRAPKSATLDEFVATELSTAPIAQPSIGSTILDGGRRMKSEKDQREEVERREYEESNFTRLAPLSKKELRKRGGGRDSGFGGEEWRGLNAGLGRIERLTQKKSGSAGALQKSRKRPIDDGPRGSGAAGDAFEKRRKIVSRFKK